jgi:hypothetical protein
LDTHVIVVLSVASPAIRAVASDPAEMDHTIGSGHLNDEATVIIQQARSCVAFLTTT